MTRSVLVCVTLVGALAVTPARADTGMLPNGAQIQFKRTFINQGGTFSETKTPDALRHYLNLAHCECSKRDRGTEKTIKFEVGLSANTGSHRPGEFWVGTNCDQDTVRAMQCRKTMTTIGDIDTLATTPVQFEFYLYDIMNGFKADGSMECVQVDGGDAALWVLIDSNGDSTYDYTTTKTLGNGTDVKAFDTLPPPLPTGFKASSAESAIAVTWTPPTARATDVYFYQALCAGPDGKPAKTNPIAPRYQTARTVCGIGPGETDEVVLGLSTIDPQAGNPMPVTTPEFTQLDPSYLCGETTEATATGMLIDGLTNDVPYTVAILAIDYYGNVAGTVFDQTITPRPATDFWEDLHNRGSTVQGGFCATSSGSSGSFVLVLGAVALLVRKRGRRTTRAIAGGAIVAALLLVPGRAHAQAGQPYWENDPLGTDNASDDARDLVKWHVGIRVGPYVPDIDKQAGLTPGPYQAMYGGAQVLPMLDVDYILWHGFGQFGVGGTLGYMQKTGYSYMEGTDPSDPNRPRSKGDKNTFRLLPFALTATYRLTWLDDEYGIPVVPYVRGGLAYYTWWVRANGKTAEVCKDGSSTPSCDKNKGTGGSLGVQGSIGLAIRAERIDASAAQSMRAGGIEHAGFYGELSLAKVDGFGSSSKLSVGAATWFAGVDFEF